MEDIGPKEGIESLMFIKETTSTIEMKWLPDNIFRSKGTVNGQECTVLIDGGRYRNIIS